MAHSESSIVIYCAALCGTICLALAQPSTCPCRIGGSMRCSNSQLQNNQHSYVAHNHPSRRLYGECLEQVDVKWKVKSCGDEEMCGLTPRAKSDITGLPYTIQSPRFADNVHKNKRFGERYFCVYNISQNCPSGSVNIQATQRSTWPNRANPDCHNYVAFYSNSSRQNPDHKYCGNGTAFNRTLHSNSFIAVMWSDENNNYGAFEFDVRCSTHPSVPTPTLSTSTVGSTATSATSAAATEMEGSAGGDIDIIPEAAIEP